MKSFNSMSDKLKIILFELFKTTLPGLNQVLATESPLKMMKNVFYITLKDLFGLSIFKFLSKFFKISKFMASCTGKQIIAMQILPNISRNKDNQTIRFGQSRTAH